MEGRVWQGLATHIASEKDKGALFCLDVDAARTFTCVVSPATCPNGIVWTKSGRTMYWIDTMRCAVFAFDYNITSGAATNQRVAFRVGGSEGEGYPDGCTIDADDMLWIAMWEGWAVRRYNPRSGELLGTYPVPAQQVTSCAFGGAALDQLYKVFERC